MQVTGVAGVRHGGQHHDQGVVIEEPVFAQLLQGEASALTGGSDEQSGDVFRRSAHLGVQFLLHVRAAGCSQKVVEHDERVTLQLEGQVVAATRESFYCKTPLFIPKTRVVPGVRGRSATTAWRATWPLQKPRRSW